MKSVNPASIRRILFVRPRFLGDVCLTLPLLEAARAACPLARVGYVVERGLAPLLAGDARVDEVIGVPARPSLGETLALVGRLRAFAPDLLVDCFCNPRTAVWAFASGARVRVGYPNKGWRSALYTHHSRPRTLSATGFHLASLAALGWPVPPVPATPRLVVTESSRAEALAALRALGVAEGAALVGFHPGARWPTRRWESANYTALAARVLTSRADAVALFTAGPGEEDGARACVAGLPAGRAFAIERWPLPRFVALQSACAAFVCGDTGPLHTAVASGARTLGLMSRNRPAMFFPYPESAGHRAYWARVECSPCHRDTCDDLRCLKRLTVDGAWALLDEMLAMPRATLPAAGGAPGPARTSGSPGA
jgi:ADP-heptose:LPS heptosyltransferase